MLKRYCYQALELGLRPLERACISAFGKRATHDPVFIIGAPRSGSTLLYQLLARHWRLAYINNLESFMPTNISVLSLLSRVCGLGRYDNHQYSSVHGRTLGLSGPAECGNLWYRWFPQGRHAVELDDVDDANREEMRQVLRAVAAIKAKPLVVKNLNCGQRLRVLARVFPDASYIFCRREPFFVAQSLLIGRQEKFGDMKSWWSVMPEGYDDLLDYPPPRQVAEQVFRLEARITKDLASLCKGQAIVVHYEQVCADPYKELVRIGDFLRSRRLPLPEKLSGDLPQLECNTAVHLDTVLAGELRKCLEVVRQSFAPGEGT